MNRTYLRFILPALVPVLFCAESVSASATTSVTVSSTLASGSAAFSSAAFSTVSAVAKPPVYENLQIARPDGLPQFESADFKVDPSRLKLYPDGFLFGDREVLARLSSFLRKDEKGIKMWDKAAAKAAKVLNRWDLDKANFNRYVYRTPQLVDLSLIYMFSGHKELGQFIRAHVLQIAGLPYEFWLHAELRGFNPQSPVGGLETASLCDAVTMSLSAAKDLFSEAETAQIKEALKNKGLVPCINWLDSKPDATNNWVAVVSTGAYHTAKFLGERDMEAKSRGRLVRYITGSFEADGSYGEGISYFDYPVKSTFLGLLAMGREGRTEYIASTGLKHSAEWKVYPLLMSSKSKNKKMSLHFGDNGYNNSMIPSVGIILASVYRSPLAVWLMDYFGGSYGIKEMLMVFSDGAGLPEPKSPAQVGLPLAKAFNAGDAYIRSSWGSDAIVLGMWSGSGSLVDYAHQRPEHGSICMGAYGEYLVVSPGSASYRSDVRYMWDVTTRAANTITIDGKNQLFPSRALYSWNKTDVSDFWVTGRPISKVLQCESGRMADLLVCEMSGAYHVPMKSVRRSVLFVKDPGYFVIVDRMDSGQDAHKYSWRIHLNNRDGKGVLEPRSESHWFFSRPYADLDIHFFSDRRVVVGQEDGYMHGPSRDYNAGGPNEGLPGSSVGLVACNAEQAPSMVCCSVLFPLRKGTTAPEVSYDGGRLIVGRDVIAIDGGECTVTRKKETQRYKLW